MGVGKGSLGWDLAVCWWRLAPSKVVGSAEEARTVSSGLWKPVPQPSELENSKEGVEKGRGVIKEEGGGATAVLVVPPEGTGSWAL